MQNLAHLALPTRVSMGTALSGRFDLQVRGILTVRPPTTQRRSRWHVGETLPIGIRWMRYERLLHRHGGHHAIPACDVEALACCLFAA